jgi:hypothetical protein
MNEITFHSPPYSIEHRRDVKKHGHNRLLKITYGKTQGERKFGQIHRYFSLAALRLRHQITGSQGLLPVRGHVCPLTLLGSTSTIRRSSITGKSSFS